MLLHKHGIGEDFKTAQPGWCPEVVWKQRQVDVLYWVLTLIVKFWRRSCLGRDDLGARLIPQPC